MLKKQLLALPADKFIPQLYNQNFRFSMTANEFTIGSDSILRATVFDLKYRMGDTVSYDNVSEFVIFIDKKNNKHLTYKPIQDTWSEGCLENLLLFYGLYEITYQSPESRTIGMNYFDVMDKETVYAISEWQMALKKFVNIEKHDRTRKYIDSISHLAGSLPKDIDQFIDIHVLPNARYMYYKREKKTLSGFCTHCRNTVTFESKKKGSLFNEIGRCPSCNSKVIYKPQGRTTLLRDESRFVYIEKIPDGFLLREYLVSRRIEKEYWKKPEQYLSEQHRCHISGKRFNYFEWDEKYSWSGKGKAQWEKMSNSYYRSLNVQGILYTSNLSKTFKGTQFQYCSLKRFADEMKSISPDMYLKEYIKYPELEYFVKMGFYNLAKDIIYDYGSSCMANPNGKTISEIIGVNRHDVKILQKLNVTKEEMLFWRWCRSQNKPIDFELMKKILCKIKKSKATDHSPQ